MSKFELDPMSMIYGKDRGVEKDLIPAIVQDTTTNRVLMLAYMNSEALGMTIDTGDATFWSRSEGGIWVKGETSGEYLGVEEVIPDCDRDAVLLRVNPAKDTVCHLGNAACFMQEGELDA